MVSWIGKLGAWLRKRKENLAALRKDKRRFKVFLGLTGAFALLVICLGITLYMRSDIQTRYSGAQSQMQEQTYQGLITMTELFARVDDPNVDVQNKLIPELKAAYASVISLNTALEDNFGAKSMVLSAEQTAAFDAAFDEYSSAYRQGLATGLAQADMQNCIDGVRAMIEARYPPEVEPTEPVVVIDGANGALVPQP